MPTAINQIDYDAFGRTYLGTDTGNCWGEDAGGLQLRNDITTTWLNGDETRSALEGNLLIWTRKDTSTSSRHHTLLLSSVYSTTS